MKCLKTKRQNQSKTKAFERIAKPFIVVRRLAHISFLHRTETYRSTFDLCVFKIVQLYSFLIMLVGDIMQLRLLTRIPLHCSDRDFNFPSSEKTFIAQKNSMPKLSFFVEYLHARLIYLLLLKCCHFVDSCNWISLLKSPTSTEDLCFAFLQKIVHLRFGGACLVGLREHVSFPIIQFLPLFLALHLCSSL